MNDEKSVSLRSGRATWVECPRSPEHLRRIIEREWRTADIRCCARCKLPFEDGQLVVRGTLQTPHGFILAKVCCPCHRRLLHDPAATERFTRASLTLLDIAIRANRSGRSSCTGKEARP